MSSLRVLVIGNNPNVLLYTWRIQQSKSVQLVHVSRSNSPKYTVETNKYGADTFTLSDHFETLEDLIKDGNHKIFDLVILSASSLQEISSLSSKLNPLLNLNTKILVESTGFVHLEPFVKMSIDFPQLKVFSIMSDFDFREVSPGNYKQYNSKESSSKIYLGESGVKSTNQNSNNGKYPKESVSLLETFKRLFMKLFPKDQVDLCNLSHVDFLSQQWKLALPKVCFDPLLILLEDPEPSQLHEQILAKPLISGLVTEIITVTKSMGAKLPPGFDNENDLLSHWLSNNGNKMPQLVFHFVHKTAPLNIDMLLLQPILLADDYGIKTPYLEFLYSMMCQFEKLNAGDSQWFCRKDEQTDLRGELSKITQERDSLEKELISTKESFGQKQQQWTRETNSRDEHYKQQISTLKSQIFKLSDELNLQQQRTAAAEEKSYHVEQRQQTPVVSSDEEQLYTSTGTPNLRDIEDIAVYGVSYNESPTAKINSNSKDSPNENLQNNSSTTKSDGIKAESVNDVTLRERELELRRKELALQEKEMELQRRVANKPRPLKIPAQMPVQPHPQALSNGGGSRKPSYGNPSSRNGRNVHGASQLNSSANFVDPVTASQPYMNSGLQQQAPMGPYHHQPHQIKATSRKNRRSNMPSLRNASSLDVLSMAGTGTAPAGLPSPGVNTTLTGPNGPAPRLNSISNGITPHPIPQRFNNGSNLQMNNIPNFAAPPTKSASTTPTGSSSSLPNQQRQISTSTTFDAVNSQQEAEISTNSVIHNPVSSPLVNGQINDALPSPMSTPIMPPNEQFSEANSGAASPAQHSSSSKVAQENVDDEFHSKEKKKSKFGLFGKKKKGKK
ncbi:LAFE_0G12662g1_1 [Lachancea fermentati]|uniref:LAFE_0G12662g1_1 n=1 Tax=Lachancea fermentati TaxID=4955 RepID=A0A1G4MI09_LACFM|nr:LAFE_0G12662g1_1 [Lachancea fermentati]